MKFEWLNWYNWPKFSQTPSHTPNFSQQIYAVHKNDEFRDKIGEIRQKASTLHHWASNFSNIINPIETCGEAAAPKTLIFFKAIVVSMIII